ncbi:hypothetical protein NL108_009666 [Boleophthalmus pectinirostris]|uniref:insulin-like growth factor-binding protein 6 n=1 Tax=Boleophthalmus pectinirostris TaxID=150288 RepID=UPI000A1C57D8|nr:insulin-like growth factor-binding protein 6 [Boleophthalmus pectinirostris]KAJ0068562.1 hypothetical protein NL108_009666 [Boleophthalmus pectinirostris]
MRCLTIFTLLLLHPLLSIQRAAHTTPAKTKTVDVNGTLGAGEQCGIYTLKCAPGLKCKAPKDEAKPLRALLEGRGTCGSSKKTVKAPTSTRTTDTTPTAAPEEAPCRKHLNSVLSALGPQLITPQEGLYLPNCTRHGFYKRRQCRSSRGTQRGQCWCVDPKGAPVNSNC